MAYVSLYRKWRPQAFEEVVGQEYVTRTLANAVRYGNIAHAYLFAGPRGTGKTSTARILAKALNCAEGPTPNPCNRCPSCQAITDGTSVDVVEIDAASNRGIDDIRDLRERVIFTPAASRMKVYILDEAHMITREAFNAFLKTLEEPPTHAVFVLATTEPHKLPQTILSRCQRHDFRSVPVPLLAEFLQKVAEEEGYRITPEALRLVARRARGSVRDALVVLEQLASYGDGAVEESDVAGFLGLIEEEFLLEMGEALVRGDLVAVISMAEKVHEEGRDLSHFAAQLQEHFRKVLLLQHAEMGAAELEVDEASLERLRGQAAMVSPTRVLHFIAALGCAREEMKQSSSPRLVLESALIAMAHEDLDNTPEALLARLERLEGQLGTMARQEAAPRRSAPGVAATPSPGRLSPAEEPLSAEEEVVGATAGEEPREVATGVEEPMGEGVAAPVSGEAEVSSAGLDLATVHRSWAQVRERVRELKVTTHAFLMEGKPARLEGNELKISFPPDRSFHRGELDKENHRRVVERALQEVFGTSLRVSTMLESEAEGGLEAAGGGRKTRVVPRQPERGREEVATEEAGSAGEPPGKAPQREKPSRGAPSDVEAEARPPGKDPGAGEAGKVKLLKDIFGAEVVEEIKLQE
ncbi:MAG: DNA polymerase III subunit gamma/tau [Actinomycetota bacterium]